jgi:hypothetical protein
MGSPFASLTVSDPIPMPGDPAHWVKVRKLTGRELERTTEAHRGGFAAGSSRMWPVTLRRALEHGATDPQVLQAIRDPLTGYDRYTLVRAGLVAWSYEQPIKAAEGQADAIDDLDDDAVDFIARAVLRLTKPGLFVESVEDSENERKNG